MRYKDLVVKPGYSILAHLDLCHELKNKNKPHELGTVDEISKRYGISKSEVRRRKADGTLHELAVQQPLNAAPPVNAV